MPALAAIAINDSVSASHTFSPVSSNGSKAELADRSPATPAGFRKIQHEVKPPAGDRKVNQVVIGFYNPVEATVDGSLVVVRSCSAQLTLNFPPESTLLDRQDMLAYVKNFLANINVKASIENIEPFY